MAKICKIILFALLIVAMPLSANAATLYFSQPAISYNVGSTFSINIYVESKDQGMNAASGIISFPPDKLEFVSLSKRGSIFSIWAEEPFFSEDDNIVNFQGLLLNPGFSGTNGKILSITFKTKAAGTAKLSFTSTSILANDGNGTNILRNSRDAVINIVKETPPTALVLKKSPSPIPNISVPKTPIAKTPLPSAKAPAILSPLKLFPNSMPAYPWNLPKATDPKSKNTATKKITPTNIINSNSVKNITTSIVNKLPITVRLIFNLGSLIFRSP